MMFRTVIINVGALAIIIPVDRCPPLLKIANTFADRRNASLHNRVLYTCMPGYHFEDDKIEALVTCGSNLEWEGYGINLLKGCQRES